jgi:hypothetical protein
MDSEHEKQYCFMHPVHTIQLSSPTLALSFWHKSFGHTFTRRTIAEPISDRLLITNFVSSSFSPSFN